MAAHVETSNFSSGYAWAKCSDCGWKGQKHIGAGKLSYSQARKEADAHDADFHAAPTADELHAEIVAILEAKGEVRFCGARYALASCYHAADHDGAHHTIGLTGAVKAF
ncbi:hypothetical protein SEA_AMYEV_60 [Arthrobacter phage Amyev]|uniref:Uncharacterized protein n=1 Tax=Arthrobacter phage Amyev TaxID=2832315 RepID=A0AA48Y3V6_9CAUD|nr:hypothetical protein PQD88_gp60 [Arthrobacter phage Amyev]UIW13475.1 hypothetical protein SEA_AMYEV_60 [Arthrobacter phage Amyev]